MAAFAFTSAAALRLFSDGFTRQPRMVATGAARCRGCDSGQHEPAPANSSHTGGCKGNDPSSFPVTFPPARRLGSGSGFAV
jgi:hypothetical protein